jgi:SAM-dependent methyltransferase
MRCRGCNAGYEITVEGIPVMLTPDARETFLFGHDAGPAADLGEEYKGRYRTNLGAQLWRVLSPPHSVYVNPEAPPLFEAPDGVNLWLGGGGVDTGPFINVDIGAFYGVGLVADAARLPFADSCCDRVTCPALLEHVDDPARVVQEVRRVLKPDGVVEAVVPFCHPYHGYPADYSRFSKDGLGHLFRDFESIEIGIRTGPATTMLTFMTYYGKLLFPVHTGNLVLRWINRIIMGAFGWISYPLVQMDRWLNRLPDAHVLANHFWVRARKPG